MEQGVTGANLNVLGLVKPPHVCLAVNGMHSRLDERFGAWLACAAAAHGEAHGCDYQDKNGLPFHGPTSLPLKGCAPGAQRDRQRPVAV